MMKAALLAAAGCLVFGGGVGHAIEKGASIPPQRTPAGTPAASTFRLEPVTASDPAGGPVWGLGLYETNRGVPCAVFGRVVDGELGMIDDGGVFHAYQPGAGPIFCHGPGGKRGGLHGDAYYDAAALARGDSNSCGFGLPPGLPVRRCPDDQVRTVRAAIVGPGVIDAAVRTRARWKRIPISAQGALIYVHRGVFSDAATPDIRVRARACGPRGRPDLLGYPRARRSGCTITLLLPHGKPVKESSRSKRNRRARRLAIPIRVGRDNTLVKRGYRLVFRYPITVRDEGNEGYGINLYGPHGERCKRAVAGTGKLFITSYFNIQGRRGSFPLAPSRNRRTWCPGRYRAQLLFVHRRYKVRNGRQITTTNIKVVGQARFRVPR